MASLNKEIYLLSNFPIVLVEKDSMTFEITSFDVTGDSFYLN